MKTRLLATGLMMGCWMGTTLQAAEPGGETVPWKNQIGLQLVAVEDEEIGYAVYGSRDLTVRDRLFLQIEMEEFNDSRHWEEEEWTYHTQSRIDVLELEVGYLRRLTSPDRPWGIHVGPSIGLLFDEGTFSSRATGPGDGGTDAEDDAGDEGGTNDDERSDGNKAAGETLSESGDVEYDLGVALYAVVLADYVFANHVGVMALFSYGYVFEQDGEFSYRTGDRRTERFTQDSDTFWNLALGATYAF